MLGNGLTGAAQNEHFLTQNNISQTQNGFPHEDFFPYADFSSLSQNLFLPHILTLDCCCLICYSLRD